MSVRTTLARLSIIAAIALPCSAIIAADEPKSPHLWEPKTKSVTVFKDGYGFFAREGAVELRDGWAVAGPLPPASFGTLAFFATNPDQLVDLASTGPGHRVRFDGIEAKNDTATKHAILDGFVNLRVVLNWKRDGLERTSTGRIDSVNDEFAMVDDGGQTIAIPLDTVTFVQVQDLPLRLHTSEGERNATGTTTLGMAYLREGITWIPEYTLTILDDNTAELSLNGLLINDAEDIIEADVNFVVGTPNFAHRAQLSPMAAGQVLRMAGGTASPEYARQFSNTFTLSNGPTEVVSSRLQGTDGRLDADIRYGESEAVEGATDFSVYRKKGLTVRTGERAMVTLLKRKVEYRHRYQCDQIGTIKHLVVLKNETEAPWTTGPMLALSGSQPLAENTFKYVPAGGEGEFPIAEAVNISSKQSEIEEKRELNAHSGKGENPPVFDLVTLKGTIELKNFEKQEAPLRIRIPVPGKPIHASDEGKLETHSGSLELTRRSGEIEWEFVLKAGESKTIEYRYERYVPSL